jgi:hypothetical protein
VIDVEFDDFNIFKLTQHGTRCVLDVYDFCVQPLAQKQDILTNVTRIETFTHHSGEVVLERLYGYMEHQNANAGLVITSGEASDFKSIVQFYFKVFASYPEYHSSTAWLLQEPDTLVCRSITEASLRDYLGRDPRVKGYFI